MTCAREAGAELRARLCSCHRTPSHLLALSQVSHHKALGGLGAVHASGLEIDSGSLSRWTNSKIVVEERRRNRWSLVRGPQMCFFISALY